MQILSTALPITLHLALQILRGVGEVAECAPSIGSEKGKMAPKETLSDFVYSSALGRERGWPGLAKFALVQG